MLTYAQAWWSKLPATFKLIGTGFGVVGAAATAIVTVPPAWAMLGLPQVAFHSYVDEQIEKAAHPLKLAQNQTQQAVDRTTASVDRLLLNQAKRDLYEAQKDPAAATSPVVQSRIQDIQDEIRQTQSRVDAASRN